MRLTYATALVLQALLDGHHHGFDIMDTTGLPSGTVYPILRRLDAEGCVQSPWEKEGVARREQRPPRRSEELTGGRQDHRARREATRAGDGRGRQAPACGRSKARAGLSNLPSLTRAIRLVRIASRLVPRRLRDDWLRGMGGGADSSRSEACLAEPKAKARARSGMRWADWLMRSRCVNATWPILQTIDDCVTGGGKCGNTAGSRLPRLPSLLSAWRHRWSRSASSRRSSSGRCPTRTTNALVTVWERHLASPARLEVAPANFLDWRARSQSFTHLAAGDPWSYDYTGRR